MDLKERIKALSQLGKWITSEINHELAPVISQAIAENGWFTEQSIKAGLHAIVDNYLDEEILSNWVNQYDIKEYGSKKVGLILAGNIPLVGIHDLICVFISGHISLLKYSSKDKVLTKSLLAQLVAINPESAPYFIEVDRLNDMDAVIATGGDTAATHFHQYFSKYPHIIRKNRSSVAVLKEEDGHEQIRALGADIFDYFGLGCRSVSKLYLPEDFKLARIFEALVDYEYVIDHNKYKNNFDYSYSIYLLGKQQFLTNNFLILMEEERLSSRIACVHYVFYKKLDEVISQIKQQTDSLQCVASSAPLPGIKHVPFGSCQSPAIDDYADGVDTLAFLTGLYEMETT